MFQVDSIIDEKWRSKFYKHLVEYAEKKLGRRSRRVIEVIDVLWKDKWSPSTRYEELMVKYRVHPGLYMLLEEAFRELGEDLDKFLEEILKPPPHHTLRVNTLKAGRNAILRYLRDAGHRVEEGMYSLNAV